MHCGEYCHKRLLCLGTPQTLKASDECLPTSSLEGTGRCVASSRTLGLDTVSTGSGSDLVSDQILESCQRQLADCSSPYYFNLAEYAEGVR